MASSKRDKPRSPSRRRFLKKTGIGVGVAVGTGVGVIPLQRTPYDAKYPVFPENRVELPDNGKTVIILGGGLSGLQAGVELSARGFRVQVLEKTGTPGGKLKTWRDKSFGPADDPAKKDPNFKGYVREHGIHAIWGFYNNLREFMHRYGWGLQDMPGGSSMYLFMDKDGSKGEFQQTTLPQPYGSIDQALRKINLDDYLGFEDKRAMGRFMRHAVSFDIHDPEQRDYLDSITFAQWAAAFDVPEAVTGKIMDSLIEMAFFDNAKSASALSLANIFQLASGSPKDMDVSLYMNPPGETFLQPMVDYIRANRGEVHYNTELTGIEVKDGKVVAVEAAQVGDGRAAVARCAVCGALLGPDGQELEKCPMCGANPEMIRMLEPGELVERRFSADYYVSAMDVPASKLFFGGAGGAISEHGYFKRIQKLQAVHVYVVNLWYEGQDFWEENITTPSGRRSHDFFATGFQDLGITLNWSLPGHYPDGIRSTIRDYDGRNVSVIETQIANAEGIAHLSDEAIVERVHQELKAVMPKIPAYRSSYVNRWRHYTAYRPGDTTNRPAIQSPLSNLLLVGDMPFIDHPAVFMEKTNVTAKMATNLLLEKIGQKEGRIRILPSGTPGLVASIKKRTGSVFP